MSALGRQLGSAFTCRAAAAKIQQHNATTLSGMDGDSHMRCPMSDRLQRVQERARQLAWSGEFKDWRSIAFKLQFEDGFTEAFHWIFGAATREELDGICKETANQSSRSAERRLPL
jgi:hypothetical protein